MNQLVKIRVRAGNKPDLQVTWLTSKELRKVDYVLFLMYMLKLRITLFYNYPFGYLGMIAACSSAAAHIAQVTQARQGKSIQNTFIIHGNKKPAIPRPHTIIIDDPLCPD